jgi:hypothetical protein
MIGTNHPPALVIGKFSGTAAADFFQIPYPIKENHDHKII